MFEAMLYMCISFGGPPECVTGENLYGPYATVPECQLRLKEMTESVIEVMPPRTIKHIRGACVDVSKQGLIFT
tara:strand:+ start:881 stop:1099 length:219 start_codon:yes stop_codon:yes gene_type:complete